MLNNQRVHTITVKLSSSQVFPFRGGWSFSTTWIPGPARSRTPQPRCRDPALDADGGEATNHRNMVHYGIVWHKPQVSRLSRLPSGKRLRNYGKSPFFMGKSTISMAIFNSKLLNYQRVSPLEWYMNGIQKADCPRVTSGRGFQAPRWISALHRKHHGARGSCGGHISGGGSSIVGIIEGDLQIFFVIWVIWNKDVYKTKQ